jgi:K+-sensing histidine kinase KdpD
MKGSYKLLSGMSHEMRGLMNEIVGFSFLMEKTCPPNEENKEYSNLILNSCNQLISLFQNYFDSAMLEAANNQVNYKRCSINSIIENSFSEFREAMTTKNRKGVVLLTEEQLTDKSEILIDHSKVSRILRGLFQNALVNTKSGYIKIGYYFGDRNVTFYVLDSGQDYNKSREFLYTEDMDKSLTKYFDIATAINIIIAKKSVQILGGKIWVDPNDSTGTGVYFSVPYKEIESSEMFSSKVMLKQFCEREFHIHSIN